MLLNLSHIILNFKYMYIYICYMRKIYPLLPLDSELFKVIRFVLVISLVFFLRNVFLSDFYRINDNSIIIILANYFKKVEINLKGHTNLRRSKHCFKLSYIANVFEIFAKC